MNRLSPRSIARLALIAGGLGAIALPIAAQDAPPTQPPTDPPKQAEPEKPAGSDAAPEKPAKPDDQSDGQSAGQTEAQAEPQSTETPPPAGSLDLDELLRLPGSQEPISRPEDAEKPESELDRRLTGRQAQEALVQAVQEMGEVADRLDQLRDGGVVTQRLQQEIITKLDVLIKSAEEQQQQQSSSQSSSSQQQGQQQPGQQQSQQSQTPGQSSQSGESPPPGRQGEQLNQDLDLSVAEWGNLPDRLRQSLIQGQSDYFSDLYRRWTESYYRRLAEEANR